MALSKIIEELANKPRNEVEADLDRIYTERARLEQEERFLRGVLELMDATQKPKKQDEESPSEQPMPGTNRDHILAIMRLRGFDHGRSRGSSRPSSTATPTHAPRQSVPRSAG